MAKKKFLQENGVQVWPISRADCIYTEDGTKLLSEVYSTKDYVDESVDNKADKIEDTVLENMLTEIFGSTTNTPE